MKEKKFEPVVTYHPAQLYEGKEWYVGFYALDPSTGKLKRVKRKLNRIKSVKERRRYGRELVKKINSQLAAGWNPFIHQEAAKSLHRLKDALRRFMEVKKSEQKIQGFKTYTSTSRIFWNWVQQEYSDDILIVAFDRQKAADFMDHVWKERTRNPVTYNNYLRFLKVFWNWMIEFRYCNASPFNGLRYKRPKPKTRTIIPASIRDIIRSYFAEKNRGYLVVLYFMFHTLIRPTELTRLKVSDVNLDSQVISIPAEATKNGKHRVITIPNSMMSDLLWYLKDSEPSWFLVGYAYRPAKKGTVTQRIRYPWEVMRRKLDLDMKYKLYSLRDTGIVQKLQDGISPEEVMKQAGHHSLHITTMYVNHVNPTGSDQVKNKSTRF